MGKGKLFELFDNRDYVVATRDVREALHGAKKEFPLEDKIIVIEAPPHIVKHELMKISTKRYDWFKKWFGDE